jgi:hypothetical protein
MEALFYSIEIKKPHDLLTIRYTFLLLNNQKGAYRND